MAVQKISVEEASQIINQTPEMVKQWIEKGRIKAEFADGCWLIPFDQLHSALEQNREQLVDHVLSDIDSTPEGQTASISYTRMETLLRERIEYLVKENADLSSWIVIQQQKMEIAKRGRKIWRIAAVLMGMVFLSGAGAAAMYWPF